MTTDSEATTVDDQPRATKPKTRRLAYLALLMLPVAILANLGTIAELIHGRRTVKGVFYGMEPGKHSQYGSWKMPEDLGKQDAKVTIEVFAHSGDGCHAPTVFVAQALGTIDPDRVRVVFRDTAMVSNGKRSEEVKLGCEQGMAVNGKVKYAVPGDAGDGKGAGGGEGARGAGGAKDAGSGERVVYLTGGHETNWRIADMHYILDKELKAAYKAKGMKMDAAEFTTRIQDEQKRLMAEAAERAKAEKEGGMTGSMPAAAAK